MSLPESQQTGSPHPFGSDITTKPDPNDIAMVLVMRDDFDLYCRKAIWGMVDRLDRGSPWSELSGGNEIQKILKKKPGNYSSNMLTKISHAQIAPRLP